MAITIKGIRLENIAIDRDAEFKISNSSYSLLSSVDKVLAKQTIGGYGGIVLEPSPATVKSLQDFMQAYQSDVVMTLGLVDA